MPYVDLLLATCALRIVSSADGLTVAPHEACGTARPHVAQYTQQMCRTGMIQHILTVCIYNVASEQYRQAVFRLGMIKVGSS